MPAIALIARRAVGSITGGTDSLVLTASGGFLVNDPIIVEVGTEAAVGRGTVGVGGQWPALGYSNTAAMNADHSQTVNTYAWDESTGNAYQWNGSVWVLNDPNLWYTAKAIPNALITTVTAVSVDGLTLTLADSAVVTATGANVFYNNRDIFQAVSFTPGAVFVMPPGQYATVGDLRIDTIPNVTLTGYSNQATQIFSPKGVTSASFTFASCPTAVAKAFSLKGNALAIGYGLNVTQTSIVAYPSGVRFIQCSGGTMQDLLVEDVFQQGLFSSLSSDIWAYRSKVIHNEGLQCYIQWMIQWADSTGGGTVDCEVVSFKLTAGIEIFRSTGVQFIRSQARNATYSINTCGDFLLDYPEILIEQGSRISDLSFSLLNPIININPNIDPTDPRMHLGGQVICPTIIQDGYLDPDHNVLIGISVAEQYHNVTITGAYPSGPGGLIQMPNYFGPTNNPFEGMGIRSGSLNLIVDGVRITNKTSGPLYGNIHIEGGTATISNSVYDNLITHDLPVTTSNDQTNAGWIGLTAIPYLTPTDLDALLHELGVNFADNIRGNITASKFRAFMTNLLIDISTPPGG